MTQPPPELPPLVAAMLAGSSQPTDAQLDALEGFAADSLAYGRRVYNLCRSQP